jgi:hypothetical protein
MNNNNSIMTLLIICCIYNRYYSVKVIEDPNSAQSFALPDLQSLPDII